MDLPCGGAMWHIRLDSPVEKQRGIATAVWKPPLRVPRLAIMDRLCPQHGNESTF